MPRFVVACTRRDGRGRVQLCEITKCNRITLTVRIALANRMSRTHSYRFATEVEIANAVWEREIA